ncbi:hypothetical protein AGIG_G18780 [Arapaima gigas]
MTSYVRTLNKPLQRSGESEEKEPEKNSLLKKRAFLFEDTARFSISHHFSPDSPAAALLKCVSRFCHSHGGRSQVGPNVTPPACSMSFFLWAVTSHTSRKLLRPTCLHPQPGWKESEMG